MQGLHFQEWHDNKNKPNAFGFAIVMAYKIMSRGTESILTNMLTLGKDGSRNDKAGFHFHSLLNDKHME